MLGLGDGIAAEDFIAFRRAYLKFQNSLPGAFLSLRPGMFADNPVALPPDGKFKFHFNLGLPGMDQFIIAGSPGLSPERPGDGIDQGGLAVAVIAADTGGMNALKVNRGYIVPVTHKIA